MHSTNLQAVGNALFNTENSQCLGIAYGWAEPAKYDEKGLITNPEALQPSVEAAANAKLWAAAPELLDVVKELITACDVTAYGSSISRARQVIVKATGEALI